MSTVTAEAASTTDRRNVIQLFDHPDADIVLRSHSHHIQVPKIYIVNSSPLPESGEILEHLLTFVFPVTPCVPSIPEEVMELLSVAQKYQMGAALSYIRATIAQQNLLPTRLEPALHLYALAQKYGLRPEALQAAQSILKYPMTIEDVYDKLDIMSGAFLYELWKYRETVRATLASDLTEFRISRACGTTTGLRCSELSSSLIPNWLDRYIESIGKAPNLFDTAELNIALARHTKDKANKQSCDFEKADLQVMRKKVGPQAQLNLTTRPPKAFNVSDANLSSESESVDGLPVLQLPESSELLNSLISLLYPVPTVVPDCYEKVLYLLAACRKYEMPSIQLSIRDRVIRKQFPEPKGTQVFPAYTIASAKKLLLEVKTAAHSTLKYSMTFETLGKGLRAFKGQALRDFADFRKRCKDNMVTCLDLYLDVQPSAPSSIWVGCPEAMPMPLTVSERPDK
ncbi:hypothetical protein BGY98DRAFT_1098311 [Russula aff. rugulosa BPL654]|nr:hypothetical protein BGY98DRAFT_1098311 [Russula aff. rugulosa BPL654]